MAQSNPFDQFDSSAQPVPVAQIAPLRPILTDPNKERDRQLREATDARDTAKSTFRTMTAEEAAAQGLPAGGVYQVNGLNEVKTIKAAPSENVVDATEGERKAASFLLRALGSNAAYESTGLGPRSLVGESLANAAPGLLNALPSAIGNSPQRQVADSSQNEFIAASLRQDSGASIPEAELDRQRRIYFPMPGDGPDVIEQKRQARLRAIAGLEQSAGRLRQNTLAEFGKMSGVTETPPTANAPAKAVSGTGNFASKEDAELQSLLNDQWAKGATLETLQSIAGPGRRIGVGTQEELDRLREQGATIVVDPTGQRSQAGELIGAAADSPVGAYAVGATNALSGVGLDELAPILGLDAETVQLAKEMLRERYPVSSALGEVSGGAQLAVGGGMALRAMGAGVPALAGAEIAQGTIYGAGEDNENRLRGAAVGAGATVVGQQLGKAIASRFATPEAQAALGKVAAETGAPPEAVQQAIIEAANRIPGAAKPSPTGALTQTVRRFQGRDYPVEVIERGVVDAEGNVFAKVRGTDTGAVGYVPDAEIFAIPNMASNSNIPAPSAADNIPGAARPTAVVTPEAATQFGEVARMAVGRGAKARAAQEQLAIAAKINPEAKAAAERLGIELPLDVISDDARLLTTTGLSRSQIGSAAQGEWGATVTNAIERADATLAEIGASRDLAQLSDDVRSRLETGMNGLEKAATKLRSEVDDAINVRDAVPANNLQRELAETINDLGGIDEAKQAFSPEEKKLLAMMGEGETAKQPTYARLNQLRDQIGRAIYKNEGPWVDAPTATLKRYYGALAKDQLDYVESKGGKELADKMRGSNDLYTRMFRSRDTMQTVFGKQLEKDIGGLVTRAVTGASKGDAKDLRTLMAAVPKDMQARTLLSGIMAKTERNSANGGFSFGEYAKMYRGLRRNEPIYKEVAKTVGPDGARILQDLYVLSSRMAAAEGKIVRTGASNQPILNAIKAETLTARTMEATKRVGSRGAGAVIGATVGSVGGVPGAAMGAAAGQEVGSALMSAISEGGKSNVDKLHTLLSSEGFRDLVEKVGTGEGVDKAINRVANDGPFRRFARSVLSLKNPEDRKSWLMRAIEVSPTVAGVEATTQEQPAMIEVR